MPAVSWVHASWLIYSFLLVFRILVGPFLLGYIHPDEFFQGGQDLFFGCPPTIPWEFEPANALRSIFPPALMTWLPLQLYNLLRVVVRAAIGGDETTRSFSGIEVLVIPRITCSLFSVLVVDRSVWAICNTGRDSQPMARNGGVPIPVLLLGSAWPTIGMLTRPFSNSLESFIFALLMATVLTMKYNDKNTFGIFFCWKIGIICALGIFTRFTFVFFAAPILLYLLRKMIQRFGIRSGILWKKIGWMAISFACVSLGIILADTIFYSLRRNEVTENLSHEISLFDVSSLVVTPFNALAYNSKVSNLKDHGLHPRWTHAVVNMLIMYGPLALATYVLVVPKLLSRVRATSTSSDHLSDSSMVSAAAVLVGLGFLSIAPHQEPRFLLPLLIPLTLLGEKPIRQFPIAGTFIWVVFNIILIVLFGVLHQGGVMKSLLAIGSTTTLAKQEHPTPWIYMLTYMPPTFLTRSQYDTPNDAQICGNDEGQGVCNQISFRYFLTMFDDGCHKEKVRVIDMKSSSLETLQETILIELPCSKRREVSNSFLYLVVPFLEQNDEDSESSFTLSLRGPRGQFQLSNETYEWNYVDGYGPHLTTENFPAFSGSFSDFYSKLSLNVYKISCAEAI